MRIGSRLSKRTHKKAQEMNNPTNKSLERSAEDFELMILREIGSYDPTAFERGQVAGIIQQAKDYARAQAADWVPNNQGFTFAWLIEWPAYSDAYGCKPATYWHPTEQWVDDAYKAIKFYSKWDAEQYLNKHVKMKLAVVTEHGFDNTTPQPACAPSGLPSSRNLKAWSDRIIGKYCEYTCKKREPNSRTPIGELEYIIIGELINLLNMEDDLRSGAAALAAPVETNTGWMTIDSAPKDGTKILLWNHKYQYAPIGHWGENDGDDCVFYGWHLDDDDDIPF